MLTCLACDGSSFKHELDLREMFFGTRGVFRYQVCATCESVQLKDQLSASGLARHYPANYYAFKAPSRETRAFERWRLRRRAAYDFGARHDLVGRILSLLNHDGLLQSWLTYGLKRDDRILDVGCGSGLLLCQLADRGCQSLTGIDPFIPHDISLPGVTIFQKSLDSMTGVFDLIMFNHALEHVPDPCASLTQAAALLASGGTCVVRIPTPSSEAFQTYGINWIQLDPPRHTFIPSRYGMAALGRRAGLALVATHDDSNAFQFWASEQYRRDIPLIDPRSYFQNKQTAEFTAAEIEAFEARARAANARGVGDQAAFVFRKVS